MWGTRAARENRATIERWRQREEGHGAVPGDEATAVELGLVVLDVYHLQGLAIRMCDVAHDNRVIHPIHAVDEGAVAASTHRSRHSIVCPVIFLHVLVLFSFFHDAVKAVQ